MRISFGRLTLNSALLLALAGCGASRSRGISVEAAAERLARMRSELRMLMVAQEAFFADRMRYAVTITALQMDRPKTGVRLQLLRVAPDRLGWAAQATDPLLEGKSCIVVVGIAPAGQFRTRGGRTPEADGVVTCD